MKSSLRFFAAIVLAASLHSAAIAQHCPYDGGTMVVVELLGHDDEPLFNSAVDLTVAEVNNPKADSCKYAPGLLKLEMRSPVEAFMARYGNYSSDAFLRMCPDCPFDRDGFYSVVLGQAERTCLIEEKGDVTPFKGREYEVRYKRGTVEQTLKLEPQNFYSMCTSAGKWSRIKPVKFKLKAPEKLPS